MPKNTYTRRRTGKQLQEKNVHLLNVFNDKTEGPVQVKIIKNGNSNKTKEKLKVTLDARPGNFSALSSISKFINKLNKSSINISVKKQLTNFLINQFGSLTFNPLGNFLGNKKADCYLQYSYTKLVIEEDENGAFTITKIEKNDLVLNKDYLKEGNDKKVLGKNFYIVTTVLRIAPDKDVVLKVDNETGDKIVNQQSTMRIESVQETVNLNALTSVGKKNENDINEYVKIHKLIPLDYLKNIKQYFGTFSPDQEKFQNAIVYFADLDEHDLNFVFGHFTTLELNKIYEAILGLEKTEVIEKCKVVAKHIANMLIERKVSPYILPKKNVDDEIKNTIKDTVLKIKNCLTSSYLFGRNINLMFTNSSKLELYEFAANLGKILIGEISETLLSRNIIESSESFLHIKNAFILYYKSSELCELYKKLSHAEARVVNQNEINWFDTIKEVICIILEEREINKKYCDYQSIDTVQTQNPQTGDNVNSSAAEISCA